MELDMDTQEQLVLEDTVIQEVRDMEVMAFKEDQVMASREDRLMVIRVLQVMGVMDTRVHQALADMDISLALGLEGMDHRDGNIFKNGSKTAWSFCFSILKRQVDAFRNT